MKKEARQAVHSVYRLLSLSAARLSFKRGSDSELVPCLPPVWVAGWVAQALAEAADVVHVLAEEVKAMHGVRSSQYLHVRALEEILRSAMELELQASKEIAPEGENKAEEEG
jgi:hypothetical protein